MNNTKIDLFKLIAEDWSAHGKDWTLPGFRAVAILRFGQWRMTIRNRFARAPMSLMYRFLFRRVRNIYGIELPYSVVFGRRVVIEHQGGIVVHGSAEIGDECIIRQGVTIGNRHLEHPFQAPVLGKRVNIGAGAAILGNVRIGDGASVGANAVVLDDVPSETAVVGVPAKPLG